MGAAVYDFEIDQGAYWSQLLLWQDQDGNPIDLSGYSAAMEIRQNVGDPDPPLVSLSTSGGGITLGGQDGTVLLEIEAAVTATLPATTGVTKCFYDLNLDPGDGRINRLIRGVMTIQPEVTR